MVRNSNHIYRESKGWIAKK